MNVDREEIYQALFQKLAALGLKTTSRRLKHIEDCQPSEFPCGYQVQDTELALSRPRMPTVWTINAEWWLYTYEPDINKAPSSVLNPVSMS